MYALNYICAHISLIGKYMQVCVCVVCVCVCVCMCVCVCVCECRAASSQAVRRTSRPGGVQASESTKLWSVRRSGEPAVSQPDRQPGTNPGQQVPRPPTSVSPRAARMSHTTRRSRLGRPLTGATAGCSTVGWRGCLGVTACAGRAVPSATSGVARASRPSKAARAKAAHAAPVRPRAPPPRHRAPPSLRGAIAELRGEAVELASADRPAIPLASGECNRWEVLTPVSGDRGASEPGLPVSSSCGPSTGPCAPPLDDLFS